MKPTSIVAAAAVAAVLAPAASQAATFKFWNTSGSAVAGQGELVFSDTATGISATVTAGTHGGYAYDDAPFKSETSCGVCVSHNANGISVSQGGSDSEEMDGYGANEFIRLTFSAPILLTRLWFNSADDYDEWDMAVDGVDFDVIAAFGTQYIEGLDDDDLMGTSSDDDRANFSANGGAVLGQEFTFYTDDSMDDYILSAMKFEAAPVVQTFQFRMSAPAPVPLPAGLPLALAGLGALGALRMSRRKAG